MYNAKELVQRETHKILSKNFIYKGNGLYERKPEVKVETKIKEITLLDKLRLLFKKPKSKVT